MALIYFNLSGKIFMVQKFIFTKTFLFLFFWGYSHVAYSKVNVFACEPEWGALAREIGGDNVNVVVATTAAQDPHYIEARPSLIASARNANLVFCTGAELEIGWLPMILEKANNASIMEGSMGYFMASDYVTLLEVPNRIDRVDGDVHTQGNPHIHLNPYNYLPIAKTLYERLSQLSPANAAYYENRHTRFRLEWKENIKRWETMAKPFQGMDIIVNHRNWIYLNNWLKLNQVSVLEPKPGIPPSIRDLERVIMHVNQKNVRAVIYAAYESPKAAEWINQKTHIPILKLPFTVGGNGGAGSLGDLFENTIKLLGTAYHASAG
jgi:zinc/manganese transport system substrate-binding protein